MSINAATKLFQPLAGDELRKILEQEFSRMLDESPNFKPHLAFSLADYQINLRITSNPPLFSPIELEVARRFEVEGEIEALVTTETASARANVGETPDNDREEAGLPTFEARRNESGIIVDQPVPPRERIVSSATVGKGTKRRGEAIKDGSELYPSVDGDPQMVNKA